MTTPPNQAAAVDCGTASLFQGWKGDAAMCFFDHSYLELPSLRRTAVLAGYRFSFALTVDDLACLRDLRTRGLAGRGKR